MSIENINQETVNRLITWGDEKSNGADITWNEIAELLNKEFFLNYSESYYRKNYKRLKEEQLYNDIKMADAAEAQVRFIQKQQEEAEKQYTDFINEQLLEIKKEKIKVRDERIQTNAVLRRLAREETIKEIAKYAVDNFEAVKSLKHYTCINQFIESDDEGILMLSDWHYGIKIDLYENKFDTEICENRIAKLLCEVKNLIKTTNIRKLHVVNLSDLIAGRIHLPLRVNSQVDTITQILRVSEILSEFINELSELVPIEFYNCLDNHSRIEPNKKESLDLESLARIVPWFIKQRLSLNENVHVNENKFGEDIITFNCNGHNVIGVHGDNDKPTQVVTNLTLLTNNIYDLMLTAHRHHFSADEENQTVIVSNGTLMGCDEYSHKLRKSSKPSQNFIVVSEDNPIKAIYRILL